MPGPYTPAGPALTAPQKAALCVQCSVLSDLCHHLRLNLAGTDAHWPSAVHVEAGPLVSGGLLTPGSCLETCSPRPQLCLDRPGPRGLALYQASSSRWGLRQHISRRKHRKLSLAHQTFLSNTQKPSARVSSCSWNRPTSVPPFTVSALTLCCEAAGPCVCVCGWTLQIFVLAPHTYSAYTPGFLPTLHTNGMLCWELLAVTLLYGYVHQLPLQLGVAMGLISEHWA